MKKPHIISILSVAVFLVAGLVWAQEETRTREEVRTEVKTRQDEVRTEIREKRENVRGEVAETREEIRIRTREATEVFKKEAEQRKEELKTRVEQKREELKTRIETKREDLKKRLEKVKDERKKQAVERIDKQMDELNDRLLKHYLSVLDKLSDVLVRISERTDRAEERGVDVAAVRTAIDEANRAISAAKTAIETQSGKTYTIQVNTEEGLKNDVGRARQALHNDLAAVRLVIKAAHEAVRQAATTLAQLPRPTPTPEATENN
ncbi:MAG TPA: hypothetical protein VJ046_03525 [Candidatus Paceibacterota bacterium]|nr:hypothetical protein [Candidatus Paceibacterota bacterium]